VQCAVQSLHCSAVCSAVHYYQCCNPLGAVLDSAVLCTALHCTAQCAVQWSAVCSADLVPGDEHCAEEAVAEARAPDPP
jgi:hypothetical protein